MRVRVIRDSGPALQRAVNDGTKPPAYELRLARTGNSHCRVTSIILLIASIDGKYVQKNLVRDVVYAVEETAGMRSFASEHNDEHLMPSINQTLFSF